MPMPVIRVENLSKRYRIVPYEPYKALRDVLVQAVVRPWKRLRSGADTREGENEIWALSRSTRPGFQARGKWPSEARSLD